MKSEGDPTGNLALLTRFSTFLRLDTKFCLKVKCIYNLSVRVLEWCAKECLFPAPTLKPAFGTNNFMEIRNSASQGLPSLPTPGAGS